MKNRKKSIFLLTIVSMMTLISCGPSQDSSIVVPEFDPNDYVEEVSTEVAKKRIIKAIENTSKIDEMSVISDIHNLEYGNSLLDVVAQTSKKETTKIKLKQIANISGLTSTDPNAILQTTKMQDIELSIIKPGICPEEDDHIAMMNGFADMYVKNNRQYVSLYDETLRNFMPYVLFGFGDFKTIEDAKKEAEKVPEKFYDPTPVFDKKDLPLGGGIANMKEEDMKSTFDYIMDLNSKTTPEFLTFKTKDENLLMNIDLNGEQIKTILAKVLKELNPDFNEKVFLTSFNQVVKINAFDMYFVIDKLDRLTYQNIAIDFNYNSTQNTDGKDYIRKDYTVIDMESYLEYKGIKFNFPSDLDSYVEYDLTLPNLPQIPTNKSK